MEYNDYRAFCKTPLRYRTTLCEISTARIFSNPKEDKVRFQISANRFLGNMVRIITGKLLMIGTGKLSIDEFESFLITKQTPSTLEPAYPQGLYLSKVTYPYLDLPPRSEFISVFDKETVNWQSVIKD